MKPYADPGDGLRRLPGADFLRLASLLSIVLFHIILRDLQAVTVRSGRSPEILDALICISSVFDNRSLAILSLFLLVYLHSDAPRSTLITERARRLLFPYLVWSIIYPFLDLGVAALAGRAGPALARVGDVQFWLSGVLLATSTGHLHFLPTMFVLTVVWMVLRPRLSLSAATALLALTSALRALIEFVVLRDNHSSSVAALATLSLARLIEYFPLGTLAAAIFASRPPSPKVRASIGIALVGLVASSIAIEPTPFYRLGPLVGLLAWTVTQAILGAVIVALAARALLTIMESETVRIPRIVAGSAWSERYAFGLFLVHPFVSNLLDVLVGFPRAFETGMILPKLVIVIIVSFLVTSCLLRIRGLTAIV